MRDVDLGIQGLRAGLMIERAFIAAGIHPPRDPNSDGDIDRVGHKDGNLIAFNVPNSFTDQEVFDLAASITDPVPIEIDRHIFALGAEIGLTEEETRTKIEAYEETIRLASLEEPTR